MVCAAVASVAFRLWVADSTTGTDDVRYWTEFAQGVRRFGPVGVYGHHFEAQYNHPPLAGWILLGLNHLTGLGLSFPFLVRLPACLADGATGIVLFLLLDRSATRNAAVMATLLFLLSPLGIIVSGFHGNTDPVFVMLAFAALYQSEVRRRPVTAGVLLALSISVKIVPVVLLPLFLSRLAGRGRRELVGFVGGGVLVFLVLWLPAVLLRPDAFLRDVLGYGGNGLVQWGIPVLSLMVGVNPADHELLFRVGGYLVLVLSALAPLLLARRRPQLHLVRFGLVLAIFLLLSPAFGMQYLVWPLAACYLVSLRYATLYNLAASLFALAVYSLWNHAYPWNWSEARSTLLPGYLVPLMLATWLALLGVVLHGAHRLWTSSTATGDVHPPQTGQTSSSAVRPVL